MKGTHPTLARRYLGSRLKRLREERSESPKQVGDAIGYDRKTISRIEKGQQSTHRLQAEALARYFEVGDEERSYLCSLALKGSERGWWESFFDVGSKEATSPAFPLLLEAEQVASHIRAIEIEVIPGLLQTPEYLKGLQQSQLPIPREVAASVAKLREKRQQLVLGREAPPQLEFYIGRIAIEYLDQLSSDVREEQVQHLLDLSEYDNIDIRIVTEMHAATNTGSFWILTMDDGFPPFVYMDALDGCRYIEQVDIVARFEDVFTTVRKSTTPIKEFLK